jgi:hypothetical protein
MSRSEKLTITLTILYMIAVWIITLIYIKPLMQ